MLQKILINIGKSSISSYFKNLYKIKRYLDPDESGKKMRSKSIEYTSCDNKEIEVEEKIRNKKAKGKLENDKVVNMHIALGKGNKNQDIKGNIHISKNNKSSAKEKQRKMRKAHFNKIKDFTYEKILNNIKPSKEKKANKMSKIKENNVEKNNESMHEQNMLENASESFEKISLGKSEKKNVSITSSLLSKPNNILLTESRSKKKKEHQELFLEDEESISLINKNKSQQLKMNYNNINDHYINFSANGNSKKNVEGSNIMEGEKIIENKNLKPTSEMTDYDNKKNKFEFLKETARILQ